MSNKSKAQCHDLYTLECAAGMVCWQKITVVGRRNSPVVATYTRRNTMIYTP